MSGFRENVTERTGPTWRVAVDRVYLTRGAVFQVSCQHTAPDGEGLHDYYDAHSEELAHVLAAEAVTELQAHPSRPPDLRAIAQGIKRRRPSLAPLTRTADGAVLLDSPADER